MENKDNFGLKYIC